MNIVIITSTFYPERNGASSSLYERLKIFSNLGHKVLVFVPDYRAINVDASAFLGEILPNVVTKTYPSQQGVYKFVCDPKFRCWKKIESDIIAFKPNVIHIEEPERLFGSSLSYPGVALAKKLKIPVTAFYHTNYMEYLPYLYKDPNAKLPWYICPLTTPLWKKLTAHVYNQYQYSMVQAPSIAERLQVMGVNNILCRKFLGVNHELFFPTPKPSTPEFKIIYVGRLTPDKEIDLLLNVLERFQQATQLPCKITIVGHGDLYSTVEAWAKKANNVELFTGLSHPEVAKLYQANDVFISCSPNETFGLTVTEAMACGLPVVAPYSDGIKDQVIDGSAGFIIKGRQVERYVEALLKLREDHALYEKMSQAAVACANAYTWENGVKEMLTSWQTLGAV